MLDSYTRIKGIEYNAVQVEARDFSVKEQEKFCKVVRTALEEVFINADVLVTCTQAPERIHFITDGTETAESWVQEYGESEVRAIGKNAWMEALDDVCRNR